jgi:signal peptidase II
MQVAMQERKKIFIILFFVLIAIDQISKYIIRTQGGFYICNKGVAFGIQLYWIAVTLIIIGFFFFLFLKKQDTRNKNQIKFKSQLSITKNKIWNLKNWLLKTGFTLIISGAISNIIDRIYFGCVIDFIDLRIWPVFNLADIYITIGAIILIFFYVFKSPFGRNHRSQK